jgi:uncharacterized protein YbbC (DUF1343 family)
MRFAGNKIFVVLASVLVGANASGAVELGIDVLESNGYALLKNKRVGLVTNQTGVDSRGARAQVLLRENCNLVALYASEHGLDGTLKAGRYVRSHRDPVTAGGSSLYIDPAAAAKFNCRQYLRAFRGRTGSCAPI